MKTTLTLHSVQNAGFPGNLCQRTVTQLLVILACAFRSVAFQTSLSEHQVAMGDFQIALPTKRAVLEKSITLKTASS